MKVYETMEIWMAAGSQHLYGEEALRQVAVDTGEIASYLDGQEGISAKIVFKGVLTTPDEITEFCIKASADAACAGVVLWMHTFSPSKMWINGLKLLTKPILHLHTQFNREIPWDSIDMDYMNLHQSAHGGREHGYINSRMKIDRKIVVGYWKDEKVIRKVDAWIRAAATHLEMQKMKVCRFGDNMREVAVTEGDKVSAQMQFGYSVSAYGLADLKAYVDKVSVEQIETLVAEYQERYTLADSLKPEGEDYPALIEAARLEAAIEAFLVDGGFTAFTSNFENLYGLCQLPGLACQRLMEKGYGFGGEGDWKTAALVRAMKVMGKGLGHGTSFMEDYTYHFQGDDSLVMGAHMLEVCPSIACENEVRIEIHPLGIGGKDDPVRMVFSTPAGEALNASVIDMGNRFRLLVNTVKAVDAPAATPLLPVAQVLWKPMPDLETAAGAWILGGGAHHTSFSQDVTVEMLEDYARICGMEMLTIDEATVIGQFEQTVKWNELYYTMKAFTKGL